MTSCSISCFTTKADSNFDEVAFESSVALPEHGNFISGMGVDCGDIDNDGYPDIAFVALDNETFPLFRNTGKGMMFEEITSSSGLTRQSRPMAGYSPAIYDFDNDGWKDLVRHARPRAVAIHERPRSGGSAQQRVPQSGKGKMTALTEEAGFTAQPPRRHRGSGQGDFERRRPAGLGGLRFGAPAEIWMNDSPGGNHWLDFNCRDQEQSRRHRRPHQAGNQRAAHSTTTFHSRWATHRQARDLFISVWGDLKPPT